MMTRLRSFRVTTGMATCAALVGGMLASGALGLNTASAEELLQFRLAKAKAVHVKDEKTAKSYEKSLKSLGVSSKLQGHEGHYDLSIACPDWRSAEFKSHAEVDKWSKWLAALGFETKHQH